MEIHAAWSELSITSPQDCGSGPIVRTTSVCACDYVSGELTSDSRLLSPHFIGLYALLIMRVNEHRNGKFA